MILYARNATPEEVRAAADYFAAQPYPKRIKVVESRTAPKKILTDGVHMPVLGDRRGHGAAREPDRRGPRQQPAGLGA